MTEAESPLDHGAAMRYESTQQNAQRKGTTTYKCECQNMQMRMNDIQSRNLKTKIDPRDRGSLASIARP
eukprot:969314-Pleurochrysis_carterae.AAC.1